jgi:hypothetical protein
MLLKGWEQLYKNPLLFNFQIVSLLEGLIVNKDLWVGRFTRRLDLPCQDQMQELKALITFDKH